MKNKWRILKILVTVVVFGFLLSFSLKRFNEKPMDKISVNMSKESPVYFIDEKDIRTLVERYNTTKKVGDIDIPSLEKKLNELPAIDSANVYLNLNGKLNLDIKQRVPVFRLNKDGKDFYVDEKGVSRMRFLDRIVVPAKTSIELMPGAIHIMLFNLKKSLNVGDKFEIEVKIEGRSPLSVTTEVKEISLNK